MAPTTSLAQVTHSWMRFGKGSDPSASPLPVFSGGIPGAENQEDGTRGEEVSRWLIMLLQEHLQRKWDHFSSDFFTKGLFQFSPLLKSLSLKKKKVNNYLPKKEIKENPQTVFTGEGRQIKGGGKGERWKPP